ncbi:MAG TPA: hypothetical protein VK179_13885 [Bacteroidales bacterium]|nr:hypothetical protein [Bacteroidales bacterium]
MITYHNETKVRDLPESFLKSVIEGLLKTAMLDLASVMDQEMFSHSVNRLVYLIQMKYKALMLGEIKYVFEGTLENLKGKLSVASVMSLFGQYASAKIEKQRQEYAAHEAEIYQGGMAVSQTPFARAIIHKMNLLETGQISIDDWENVKLKDIAEDIESGKIKVFMPETRKKNSNYEA